MLALSDAKFSIERPKYTGKVCDEYHLSTHLQHQTAN